MKVDKWGMLLLYLNVLSTEKETSCLIRSITDEGVQVAGQRTMMVVHEVVADMVTMGGSAGASGSDFRHALSDEREKIFPLPKIVQGNTVRSYDLTRTKTRLKTQKMTPYHKSADLQPSLIFRDKKGLFFC